MAKNLTLGRILALMPHCCNKNGNGTGNSITTVEHTLDINQSNILDLSGDNNKQIAAIYVDSCNEEEYNKFIEDPLDSSNFDSSPITLLGFTAQTEDEVQTSFEVILDPTTYALMIEFGIYNPVSDSIEWWDTHNPNLPVTANSHYSLFAHPVSLEDLVSENGVNVYYIDSSGDDLSINENEDFKLYCQYNSETNKLTLSVVPFIKQNNLVSTVTVNGITAQDQVEFPSLEETTTESSPNIISGYLDYNSNDPSLGLFNILDQTAIDNLNPTGAVIFIADTKAFSGIRSIQIDNSSVIEANIESEEVINDFQR